MLVHCRVTPSTKFAATHLYTWVEKGTVRVKCLTQEHNTMSPARARTRGPFLDRPGNLTGPISYFEIKVSRRVGCVLTSNEVQFVSLADNFTVQFSNLLKLSSGMENQNTLTGLSGASRNGPPDRSLRGRAH